MENQNKNTNVSPVSDGIGQPVSSGFVTPEPVANDTEALSQYQPTPLAEPIVSQVSPKSSALAKHSLKRIGIAVIILVLLGLGFLLYTYLSKKQTTSSSATVATQYATQQVSLTGITVSQQGLQLTAGNVIINGPLKLNEGVVITPSVQPNAPVSGQLYYDQNTNQLAYYNGTAFVPLTASGQVVQSIGGVSGQLTLGGGLNVVGNQLGVTFPQTVIPPNVSSLGGKTGDITLGSGLTLAGNELQNKGVLNVLAGTNIAVTNDGAGNYTVINTGAGTGTVSSSGGTNGTIPLFTAAQNIENSIITQTGLTVTVTGDLSIVTGGLSLTNALTVSNGGTGANSLAANGVIVGSGTAALTSVAAGSAGLCLVSTAGAPTWAACPGGSGVSTLNGLSGALTVANASAAGSTITIDDASTTTKGIASFNSTNFTASGGTINTVQNINTGATPTFAGLNTNSITPSAAMTVGVTTQTLLLQGSTATITSTGAGNDITLNSADTIELQDNTNVTGNLDVSGTLDVGTANALQVAANGNLTTAGIITAQGGSVTAGAALQAGNIILYDGSSNTGTIQTASLGQNTVYNLPDPGQVSVDICLSTGNCGAAGVTLQGAYNNSTSPEIVLDATRGALTIRDNAVPLAANLLEVQNNAGGTTYFAVNATGASVTGTTTSTGNINSSGGALQTNGTTRIDNSGNASNIGSLTLSGAISGGTSYSGSGNINSTAGALQTAGTTRVDNSGNLTNIGNITGTGAVTIASTGAGNDVTIDGADQFIIQDAAVFNSQSTFNTDVDLVFADTENLSITTTVTNSNSVDLISAVMTNNTVAGTQQMMLLQNAAGSGSTEGFIVLNNADSDTAVTSGLQITSAAGGITNALDVSDPDIVTALLFGANDISGTNFTVTGSSGDVVSSGNATLQGGTVTVGTTTQAGNIVISDGSSNTATIQVAALGQNTVYTLPDPSLASATICLSTGNCAGSGSGVTTTGGTVNRLSKFSAVQAIADSTISDDGTNVTTSIDLIIQGGDVTVGVVNSQTGTIKLADGGSAFMGSFVQGSLTANRTYTLPNLDGTVCLSSGNCSGSGSLNTLQAAYDAGNTLTTSTARDINFTLADSATDANFTITTATGSSGTVSIVRADGAGTVDPAQLLLLDNLDTNRAQPIGLKIQSAAGGMSTGIDASDAEIVDAMNVGANNIVGTTGNIDLSNFDVVGSSGDITTAGDIAVNGGNVTSTGSLTISSAAASNIILNSANTIELQDNTNVTGNADVSGTLDVGTANAFQVAANGNITTAGTATIQGGSITTGTTSQGGIVILYDGSSNTGTIQTTALGANRVYTLPDDTGTICLDTGNCAGAGATLQTSYNNSTIPQITLDATRGALTVRDNATPIGTNLLQVQSTGGATTYFAVSSTGVNATGTATISGNINTTGGTVQTNSTNRIDNSGNLVNIGNITGTGAVTIASAGSGNDVIVNGADQFVVQDAAVFNDLVQINYSTPSGVLNYDAATIAVTNNSSGGTQNGLVINNTATGNATEALIALSNADAGAAVAAGIKVVSSTGTITTGIDLSSTSVGSALNIGDNSITGTTPDLDFTNFDLTGSTGTITSAGNAILQGGSITAGTTTQAGGIILYDGSSNTGTIQTASLGQNTVYSLPDPGIATVNICLSTGNCAGAGTGVTTTGGTIGTIPVFTASQQIADSLLSQAAGTVTVAGNLNLTTGSQFQINSTQISSANLSNDSNLAKLSASQTFTGNTVAFQNGSNSVNAFNIQNSTGNRILTVDTSNNQILLGLASTLDGKLVFSNVSNANTVTIQPGTPTANRVITLPNAGGILCTDSGNCAGAGSTLQTSYNFSTGGTTPKIKVNDTLLGVDIQDADTTIAADLFDVRASNASGLGSVMFGVGSTGQITMQNAANSATALRVLTQGGTGVVTIDTTNGQTILGQSSTLAGTLVFSNATNANKISIVPSAATANRTLTLPNVDGTICTDAGNCAGAGVTLQSSYNNSTNPEIVLDATRGALTVRDNATPLAANLFEVQNNAGGTNYFSVDASGVGITGALIASGNINTTSGTIQTNATNRIDNSGNLVNIGTVSTSGAINSQTISSASNFTGTVTIQGTNALTLGTTGTNTGAILFKGATGASGTLTLLGPANPSTNTITLPNETGTVCTTGSVCTGYAPASGSGSYIQNGTSLQSNASFIIQSAADTNITAALRSRASQTADLLQIQSSTGGISAGIRPSGAIYSAPISDPETDVPGNARLFVQPLAAASTAIIARVSAGGSPTGDILQLQDATGANNLLRVDVNGALILATGGATALNISNAATTTDISMQNGETIDNDTDGTIRLSTTIANVTGSLQTNGTTRLDFSGNLTNIGNITGTGAITIASTGAGSDVIIDGADQFIVQDASTFSSTVVIQGTNALTLGTTGTNTGAILFKGATGASGTLTLLGPANPSTNTITLPNETGTVCTTGSVCTGYAPASGSGSYIQNQNASQQATSNYWISGTGRADTSLQAPLIDTATAATLAIGTTNATAINLNQNTTVTAGKQLIVTSALTTLTGATVGDALAVSNSTSTGRIAVFMDNASEVFVIGNGGSTSLTTTTDSATAFTVQGTAALSVMTADTYNNTARLRTVYANNASTFDAIWLQGNKNGVTAFIGGNDNVDAYTANESSGSLRFNGSNLAWGDFGYYPTGGGDGNYGQFRLSTTGSAINTTPNAKLGVGDLYVTNEIGINNTSPTEALDVTGNINIGSANGYKIGSVIAVEASGGYLRINQANQFANGIYTGTSGVRIGGTTGLLVGSVGGDGQIGLIPSGADNTRRITLDGGTGAIQGYTEVLSGATSGDALSVSNGTSTGNIALFKDNSTTVGTIADGGATTFQNSTNSTAAFRVLSSGGSSLFSIDSTNGGAATLLGLNSGEIGSWSTGTNTLTSARAFAATATANGYVYVIGGNDTGGTAQTTIYYSRLNTDGSVGAWSTAAYSLPSARVGATAIAYNGYLYVLGGENSAGAEQTTSYFARINADGTIGSWYTTTVLPAARRGGSVVTANGYMYYIGGQDSANTAVDTVYYSQINSDGTLGAWTTNATALTGKRYMPQTVIANGYLYVTGGTDETGARRSTVYYGSLSSTGAIASWSTAANAMPGVRAEGSAVTANGYIYTYGGRNGSVYLTSVYYSKLAADGSPGTWSTATNSLPLLRGGGSSLIVNGYMYMIGGYNGTTATNTVYYSSVARVQIGASLDLVGLQGQNLASGGDTGQGSTGGSITAGNGTFVGSMQVQGMTNLNQGLNVNGITTLTGSTYITGDLALTSELAAYEGFENVTFPPSGGTGTWTTGGNANWARSTTVYEEGAASAASGDITDSQETWLDMDYTFSQNGSITFAWRVSSEQGWDYLNFCIDNDASCATSPTYFMSGESGWQQLTVPVTKGNHSFRWVYAKDLSATEGSDMGWVDNVRFNGGAGSITGNGINFDLAPGYNITIGDGDNTNTPSLLVLDDMDSYTDPTGVNGGMYYNSQLKSFRCFQDGTWRSCADGLVYTNTTWPSGACGSGNTVANTTSACNFASSYVMHDDACQTGKVYKVIANGYLSTNSGTFMISIMKGSTVLNTTGAATISSGMGSTQWAMTGYITCIDTDEVDSWATFEYTNFNNDATNRWIQWSMPEGGTYPGSFGSTTSIDSARENLQVQVQWGTANASNSATLRQLIIEEEGP